MEAFRSPIEQIWFEYPLGNTRRGFNARIPNGPSIRDVIKAASMQFRVPVDYILDDRRKKDIVYARHVAMHVAYAMTHSSTTTIGRVFNGRDHTTVIHAVYKIENWIKQGKNEVISDVFLLKARAYDVAQERIARFND